MTMVALRRRITSRDLLSDKLSVCRLCLIRLDVRQLLLTCVTLARVAELLVRHIDKLKFVGHRFLTLVFWLNI